MKQKSVLIKKAIVTLFCLALLVVSLPTMAGTPKNPQAIPMIKAPQVPTDAENFQFIVFGDTRTGDKDDKSPKDQAFHRFRDMVFRQVSDGLKGNRSFFALFSGDMIWKGGVEYYWQQVKQELDDAVRAKIFPIIGNHETWTDDTGVKDPLKLYFATFPHIGENHNYAFRVRNALFINLCAGGYGADYTKENAIKWDRAWTCKEWTYQQVETAMDQLVDKYLTGKDPVQHIFVQCHKPSYSFYKHPPLDDANDPMQLLLTYKKKYPGLKTVFVFNGHNHTTEMYHPADGAWAIVAGGGGAPQSRIAMNSFTKDEPELFWAALGKPLVPREGRINYYTVTVNTKNGTVVIQEKCLMGTPDGWTYWADGVRIADDTLYVPSTNIADFQKAVAN